MMEKRYIIFMESIHGNLSDNIQGLDREEKWSDLWYIFIPDGNEKTLAQMNDEERETRRKVNSIDSMNEFAKWYEKQ